MNSPGANRIPLSEYRKSVSQRLSKAPFGWGLATAQELQQQYADLVEAYWAHCSSVGDTAHAVHTLFVGPLKQVTRLSQSVLESAGYRYEGQGQCGNDHVHPLFAGILASFAPHIGERHAATEEEVTPHAAIDTLEGICLRILKIGNDQVRAGRINEGLELCELIDKLLLTLQAKQIEHEAPVTVLPEALRGKTDAGAQPNGLEQRVGTAEELR